MNAEEGSRRARDEDAGLVDGVVGWIEGTVVFEGAFFQGEQEGRCHPLIYGVFGYVDEKEGEHTTNVVSGGLGVLMVKKDSY